MNELIQFSIIVPVYNVEAYLPQAIESVLAQRVTDWEMILVDDGSLDRSGEICDQYVAMDERIRVIHKGNGGLVSARQAGIAVCRGNYVLNLDSDDYWSEDLLSELETVIDQYHPDCISFGYLRVAEDGKPISELRSKIPEGFYSGEELRQVRNVMLYNPQNPEVNIGDIVYCAGTVAFRREMVSPIQLRVPKKIKLGEDVAVTIPFFSQCSSIYILDEIPYFYRCRTNAITQTFSYSEIQETMQLIQYLKTYAQKLPTENLVGYLYRLTENYWIKAARNLPNYREFKRCVDASLKIVPEEAIQYISNFHLNLKYTLRYFVIKNHFWLVFWLFYHRG